MFANLEELTEFEYQIIKIMHENKKLLPDDNNQLNLLLGLAGSNERAKVLGEKEIGYDFILLQLKKYGVDVSSLTHVTEGYLACQTRDAEQRNAPTEAGGDWVCIKCKTRNSDDKSICGFCDTPRLGG